MNFITVSRAYLFVCAAFLYSTFLGARLGEAASFRNLQYGFAMVLAVQFLKNPREDARASRLSLVLFYVCSLIWCVAASATHFGSFNINGVDFSIFEWMIHNTLHGRFGYSPIYDVNHFGVHSTFILLPMVAVYSLAPSPYWFVVLGPAALWAGLFPLNRLVRWAAHGDSPGWMGLVVALAYISSAWMGLVLIGGFRIESLIPVFSLWFLVGWVENKRWLWIGAVIALLLTKEDTALMLIALAPAVFWKERHRWREAVLLFAMSAAWLFVYTRMIQPMLLGGTPGYATFWRDFGDTPLHALIGMAKRPLDTLTRLATSGIWKFYLPLLMLPWMSLRASGAMVPTVFLLGTASYDHMHDFGGYYPLPLIAFSLFGILELLRESRIPGAVAAVALLFFPLYKGGYVKMIGIEWSKLSKMDEVRQTLETYPRVCVQTALWPHMRYPTVEVQPLFDLNCGDAPNTAVVFNLEVDTYPNKRWELEKAYANWKATRRTHELGEGFVLVEPLPPG